MSTQSRSIPATAYPSSVARAPRFNSPGPSMSPTDGSPDLYHEARVRNVPAAPPSALRAPLNFFEADDLASELDDLFGPEELGADIPAYDIAELQLAMDAQSPEPPAAPLLLEGSAPGPALAPAPAGHQDVGNLFGAFVNMAMVPFGGDQPDAFLQAMLNAPVAQVPLIRGKHAAIVS